ncbi:MAG TPA: hypothetical protein PKA31_02030 [Candidatus Moranbacteria bacterium]|nr:hypothetical protein [Candidatus Moranbacteria bacterium]
MQRKIKTAAYAAAGILLAAASGASAADWGVGMDSSGNWAIGVGSAGSGAGNVWGRWGGWSMINPGLPEGSIFGILQNLLFWLLAIFGILGVMGFVISGIYYLTAAGDQKQIDTGKTGMKYSIIGIIVGLSGFIVMQAVAALLSGTSNRF